MEILNPPVLSSLPEIQLLADRTGIPADYFDHVGTFDLKDLREYYLIFGQLTVEQGYVICSYSNHCDSENVYLLRYLYDQVEPQLYVMESSIFDCLLNELEPAKN